MNDFDTQFALADEQFDAVFGEMLSYTVVGASEATSITAVVSGPAIQHVNSEDGRGIIKRLTVWFDSGDIAEPQRGDAVTYNSVSYVFANESLAEKNGTSWRVEFERFERTKAQSNNLEKRR
jgi:hypothetical protein